MIPEIKKLFAHKELIAALTMKELKARYKNASIGFGWTILSPLALMIIFAVIFKLIFRIKIENYPVFLLSGLLPWTFFAVSLSEATTSIVSNAGLIKKRYFAREVIPISLVLSKLIKFVLSLVVLSIFILIYRIPLSPAIIWLPIIILIQLILITGLSLILSSFYVYYRDVRYIMEILLRIWFYATPIIYSVAMVKDALPAHLFKSYMLNPMVGIISAYHNILLYGQGPDLRWLAISMLISIIILMLGFTIFRRCEPLFADMA